MTKALKVPLSRNDLWTEVLSSKMEQTPLPKIRSQPSPEEGGIHLEDLEEFGWLEKEKSKAKSLRKINAKFSTESGIPMEHAGALLKYLKPVDLKTAFETMFNNVGNALLDLLECDIESEDTNSCSGEELLSETDDLAGRNKSLDAEGTVKDNQDLGLADNNIDVHEANQAESETEIASQDERVSVGSSEPTEFAEASLEGDDISANTELRTFEKGIESEEGGFNSDDDAECTVKDDQDLGLIENTSQGGGEASESTETEVGTSEKGVESNELDSDLDSNQGDSTIDSNSDTDPKNTSEASSDETQPTHDDVATVEASEDNAGEILEEMIELIFGDAEDLKNKVLDEMRKRRFEDAQDLRQSTLDESIEVLQEETANSVEEIKAELSEEKQEALLGDAEGIKEEVSEERREVLVEDAQELQKEIRDEILEIWTEEAEELFEELLDEMIEGQLFGDIYDSDEIEETAVEPLEMKDTEESEVSDTDEKQDSEDQGMEVAEIDTEGTEQEIEDVEGDEKIEEDIDGTEVTSDDDGLEELELDPDADEVEREDLDVLEGTENEDHDEEEAETEEENLDGIEAPEGVEEVHETHKKDDDLGMEEGGSHIVVGSEEGRLQLATKLSKRLFGVYAEPFRLDMSEYQDENAVERLVGVRGRAEGGTLTNALHHRPYSVVLLDKVDRAHSKVLEVLVQATEQGGLTDGQGKTADLSKAILVLGTQVGPDRAVGLAKEELLTELSNSLHPGLLHRFEVLSTY